MSILHTLAPWALATGCACCAAQSTDTVLITGNPLGRSLAATPATVLTGEALQLRRAGTLGETLDGLPGVAGSGFGPHSNRPVIRGLDGDRVRLLDNGGVSPDASNLSFDHAVALDPLVVERLEVLRGPSALLYGGNATGGVVNAIDNRIPRAPAPGLAARGDMRLGGAARERAGAVVLDGGSGAAGGLAWHVDAFGRRAQDLRTPAFTPLEDGQPLPVAERVRNSVGHSGGGALGMSWVAPQGFLGASVETLHNHYGVTVEPDVTIRLVRDRLALAGEWRSPAAALRQVSLQASHTRYAHDELEGDGAVGTHFASRGQELRLQLDHQPWGPLQGVVGLQAERLDFSALGEEAFVPGTRTRSAALFVLEELALGATALSAGARLEQVQVASDGDADADAPPRFGEPAKRRFRPLSLSLAARRDLADGWQASVTLGRTQRAPAYYELYANGAHVATAAYERGDATLGLESSRHVEAGLAFRQGEQLFKAQVFETRFSRYLALDATGASIEQPGEEGEPPAALPEYAFRAVRARLRGVELEARTGWSGAGWQWQASGSLDAVRGDNLDAGEPLPRLAPLRVNAALQATRGALRLGLTVAHAARQSRVPANDTATAASTRVDLWAQGQVSETTGLGWFVRLANLGNRLAFNAAAVPTVRGLSPAGGRALSLGLQWRT